MVLADTEAINAKVVCEHGLFDYIADDLRMR